MGDEREAFLQQIAERPDEDTVRLVFADWLDEHDEPARAAFIRAQCAGSAIGNPGTRMVRECLRRAASAFRLEWLAEELPGLAALAAKVTVPPVATGVAVIVCFFLGQALVVVRVRWRRGFVSEVDCAGWLSSATLTELNSLIPPSVRLFTVSSARAFDWLRQLILNSNKCTSGS